MGLVSLLNRAFRTNVLSAPLAAMAGGAEGVSVMHPIEAQGSSSREEAATPEATASADTKPEETDENPDPMPDMASQMRAAIALYGMEKNLDLDEEENAPGDERDRNVPIVRLANTILQQAIKEGASDIHLEPGMRNMRVRYRIDGVLHEAMPMPKYIQIPLTNRYKVLAGIDMATHRGQPQEGRISLRYDGNDYRLRVNTLPTEHGDHLTFQITGPVNRVHGFAQLGFVPDMQAQLQNLLYRQHGLLLITGPSGSGKTTLQYAALNFLNTVGVHIVTVEERLGYRLPGVTQIVVDPSEGGSLPSTVREALLNDIDVLSISDIRDKATAQAALDAAAGSLVIATIRGDNTLSTLVRLMGMGFDPGLITETVCGVVAQRLVRKICTHCIETYEVESKELRRFGLAAENPEEKVTLARGTGCEHCRQTGYKGRVGLYELFQWEPTLTKMFSDRAPLPHLKEAAFWNDRMRDLKADGLVKILAHLTTPQEVLRVL